MHFTRHSSYAGAEMPTIVRGEGSYIYDITASATLTASRGCSSSRPGTGAASWPRPPPSRRRSWPSSRCGPTRTPRPPSWPQRLARLGARRPQPGLLHHRRRRGRRVRLEAGQAVLQDHRQAAQAQGHQPQIAYHGTPQGALSITGIPAFKQMFEPLVPGSIRVPNTNHYRAEEITGVPGMTPEQYGYWAADRVARAIEMEGPDTVAAVFARAGAERRRLLPAAARLLPAAARDLRRVRRPARLRRGHLRLRPPRHHVRRRRSSTTCPT